MFLFHNPLSFRHNIIQTTNYYSNFLKLECNISKHDIFQIEKEIKKNRIIYFQVVELNDALAINSTAVRLDWHLHISGNEEYIEVSGHHSVSCIF